VNLTAVTGLVMLVGLLGIVVPVLPGLLLVWLATALWAYDHPAPSAWVVFGVATVLYAGGLVSQYVVPGRRMRQAGVGTWTLMLAVVLAVVGFFVLPVVGAVVGFVLGIFLVELSRQHDRGAAWVSTKHALKGVALSMGIELAAGFAIVLTWLIGVLTLGTGS
jgi:uncharacterized protein YqgC (DUF456 family)